LPLSFSPAVEQLLVNYWAGERGRWACTTALHNSILVIKFGPVHYRATAYGPRLQTVQHSVDDIFANENENKNKDYFEDKNYTAHS